MSTADGARPDLARRMNGRAATGRAFALSLGVCLTLGGAASELNLAVPRESATQHRCESQLVRRCAAPVDTATDESGFRDLQRRRGATDLDRILEAVVIEGERLRRPPTVAEAIEAATARQTVRSFESGDGGQCTCVKPCPPWPSACCTCDKGGRDAKINNLLRH